MVSSAVGLSDKICFCDMSPEPARYQASSPSLNPNYPKNVRVLLDVVYVRLRLNSVALTVP